MNDTQKTDVCVEAGRASLDREAWEALAFLSGLCPSLTCDLDQPMVAAQGIFDAVQADRAEWMRRATEADASVVTMNRLYAKTCDAQSELAMMLKLCAHKLRRSGDADLGDKAVELLRKHDLIGSPLRVDSTPVLPEGC
ncbi:hypothetical protein [Piscinibacter terrae]|nr:hypothetical protein [Albitalea terrae]